MASSDFKTELVRDSRLNIKEEIVYNVHSGPSQSTYQPYTSNSASNTNVTFTVQAPSESVVMSRDVLFQATCEFRVVITLPDPIPAEIPAGSYVFRYGVSDAFQAFPLNHLIQTATATINNSSVSINESDVLPALLIYMDKDKLNKYNCMTPTFLDNYKNFSDCASLAQPPVFASNNPLSGYKDSLDSNNIGRGSHPISNYAIVVSAGAVNTLAAVGKTYTITFKATFTEPLFLSPFIFSGLSEHPAGLLGVNQFNLNLNLDNTCKNAWCSALPTPAGVTYTCSLTAISDAKLLVNYLSLQPTQIVASKNVVDYLEYNRFLTMPNNTAEIAAGADGDVVLQNVQLSQIPDLILLYARDSVSNYNKSETFLPILSVSCNFNNVSGLLSSASQQQLFKMSKNAGCNMNWYEWSGYAATGNGAAAANGNQISISTVGSVLGIKPSAELNLPAMLSEGSSGQFNLQFNIKLKNNTNANLTPQIVLICVNSGLFICNQGTSQIYKALLTMDQVLKTSEESKFQTSDEDDTRMIGNGFNKMSHSVSKKGMGRSGGMRQSKLHSFV